MTHDLKTKVCGMTRREDAALAAGLGADMLGFIFHTPSPRNVTPDFAASTDTGQALRVGVFVRQDPDEICRVMDAARLDLAQLAGDQDPDACRAVGPERVMRVFWPERHGNAPDLEMELARFAGCMRFALLDAGTSGGGHGRSMDFKLLSGIVCPAPWWLAGGLSPDNLDNAVRQCAPFGVDVNSGVESAPGIKDAARLKAAFAAVKKYRTQGEG